MGGDEEGEGRGRRRRGEGTKKDEKHGQKTYHYPLSKETNERYFRNPDYWS